MARMDVETFDEQLSRCLSARDQPRHLDLYAFHLFDLMCNGDPTWDLSEKDIDALNAVRTEMRIIAAANRILNERLAELQWREITPENLPKKGSSVLVWFGNCAKPYADVWIFSGANQYFTGNPSKHRKEDVTHWAPLLSAPARADEASK